MNTRQTSGSCCTLVYLCVSLGRQPFGRQNKSLQSACQHWYNMIPAQFPVWSSTTTQYYKPPNTFPSCAVPSARQEICLGDLASNRQCHRDLGPMPASNKSGKRINNLRSLGRTRRSIICFRVMVWLVSEKFLLTFKFWYFQSAKVWVYFSLTGSAELCSKFGLCVKMLSKAEICRPSIKLHLPSNSIAGCNYLSTNLQSTSHRCNRLKLE